MTLNWPSHNFACKFEFGKFMILKVVALLFWHHSMSFVASRRNYAWNMFFTIRTVNQRSSDSDCFRLELVKSENKEFGQWMYVITILPFSVFRSSCWATVIFPFRMMDIKGKAQPSFKLFWWAIEFNWKRRIN